MTLGVTIGMSTTASPQSFGSKVVLLTPVGVLVGSLIVPLAETSAVVPDAVPSEAEPLSLSVAGKVVRVIEPADIVFVADIEFEAEPDSSPLSVHATVRADIRDRRHALRFISW
jgi:hypothetical protein